MSDQRSQGSRGQQGQRSLALWVTMKKAAYWTKRWEEAPSVLSGERALMVMAVNPPWLVLREVSIPSILRTQVLPDDFHLGNLYSKGQEEIIKEVWDKVAYNEGKLESVSLYLVLKRMNLCVCVWIKSWHAQVCLMYCWSPCQRASPSAAHQNRLDH